MNNILKVSLLWKEARWKVVLKFGLPAFLMAFFGAKLLFILEKIEPLYIYQISDKTMEISALKIVIAILLLLFLVLETFPKFKDISFSEKILPFGGALSGFFGGLSGHQGALRSMFLLKAGLNKEGYIATGVIVAAMVDVSRISVYWNNIIQSDYESHLLVMSLAVIFAFAGVFIGRKTLKKIKMQTVQNIVGVMLFLIAVLLSAGII
ncbi:MAG: TSUP family transporter [Elusimicrobiota bacterium]|nr:TSUP family transporter [Elusimicrobiota bacterium]